MHQGDVFYWNDNTVLENHLTDELSLENRETILREIANPICSGFEDKAITLSNS